MAHVVEDRVAETSTTTGTGAMALSAAVPGYRRFNSVCSVADTVHYMIVADTGDWESGLGTYSALNTLTRTTVRRSSNANAAVSFAAGSKQVFLYFPGVALAATASWQAKTGNYTAVNGDRLLCNTTAGAFTVTLPSSPAIGHSVRIKAGPAASTNNLTIGRNGQTIMGLAEDMTVPANNVDFELVFDGTTWRI